MLINDIKLEIVIILTSMSSLTDVFIVLVLLYNELTFGKYLLILEWILFESLRDCDLIIEPYILNIGIPMKK